MDRRTLDALSDVFAYPAEDAVADIEAACEVIVELGEPTTGGARGLLQLIADEGSGAAEEHFTRVFDVNPKRNLECGWHLYGEDYARGAFLVQMRNMLCALGVEEGSELPDYLPTLLRGLARLPAGKAAIFSTSYLQPALTRMLEGFEGRETPYGEILRGLLPALEAAYGPTSTEAAAPPAQATPYAGVAGCSGPSFPDAGGSHAR